ncbi:hypothetical protein Tco_0670169 [Tanacetum coccineum]
MAEQDIPPPTITAMKIPIIRKGEYDIWSMRMRQYICHTDHNLWDVIVNGDLEEEPAPTGETSAPPAPKTAKQLVAKRNQERVKSILLLAIPDEYLLKFHNVADAKSLWEAIKSRFGGNEESKKMQKNVLKHQFENFSTASNESLDKAYDRFQKLISQLEVHGAPISKEDINQKFLRSLPPSWNQIALIMRNKPDIDEIDIDDLYNNLRVYEDEMKRSSSSTSTSQNLAFLSSENTSSTNEDWNSDDEDDVSEVQTVSPVKTNETQTVKTRVDKIGQTSQKQGIRFKKIKACFVCKSTDHLIKDCTFHDKQSQEPKLKIVVNTGPRVDKPVWDNTKRVNHQKISKYPHLRKTFVPSGVLTRTVSTARPVSTVRPFAPKQHKLVVLLDQFTIRRSYYTKPSFRPKNLKQDVKTFEIKNMTTAGIRAIVNTGKGKMENDLKKSKACWVWRPKLKVLDHDFKNSGSYICKQFDYVDPTGRIKLVMDWVPKRN